MSSIDVTRTMTIRICLNPIQMMLMTVTSIAFTTFPWFLLILFLIWRKAWKIYKTVKYFPVISEKNNKPIHCLQQWLSFPLQLMCHLDAWRKLSRNVSYKRIGAPDQGQMLDVWGSQTAESALTWQTCYVAPHHILELTLEVIPDHKLGIKTMTLVFSPGSHCRRPPILCTVQEYFWCADKVRRDTCDMARPLSQVWGVEPNTSLRYEVAEHPRHRLNAGLSIPA